MTSKIEGLRKFGSRFIKIKHVKEIICDEVCDMVDAWKEDRFAPEATVLDGLSDDDFMKKYKEVVYKTAQHEGAEAILYVMEFFDSHDINIIPYVEALQRERALYVAKMAGDTPEPVPVIPKVPSASMVTYIPR